jgi:aminoglycoside/choline kinase family phosphotransferase
MTPSKIEWPSAQRQTAFAQWLAGLTGAWALEADTLAPASADASFRRYLRIQGQQHGRACNFIVMDAPPPQEDVRPFVRIGALIRQAGLHAPEVLAADEHNGFLLLEDLGGTLYLKAMQAEPATGPGTPADTLMRAAITALVQFQTGVPAAALPPYDEAVLRRELELFPQWCVKQEFGTDWTAEQQGHWERVSRLLIDSALAQPVVAVHRDWMPRNLMVTEPGPGILDFQDALAGPITYDFASLLRDAFISWDEAQEIDWAVRGWEAARKAGLPVAEDFGEHWRQLEWMGLQRHLKVLGIFCRLKHRDGKPAYAQDLPRFFNYATKVALRYRELSPLLKLLEPLSGRQVAAGFTF